MSLRLLNWQGIVGLGTALVLAILLIIQKVEARHWRKQSAAFEQLYQREQAAFAVTVANVRTEAAAANAADRANADRVRAEQQSINERSEHDLETRLAAARAAAARVRDEARASAADPGRGTAAPMSGLPAPAGGADDPAQEDGLPLADALIATEQALQLDELIKWVKAQAAVSTGDKPALQQ